MRRFLLCASFLCCFVTVRAVDGVPVTPAMAEVACVVAPTNTVHPMAAPGLLARFWCVVRELVAVFWIAARKFDDDITGRRAYDDAD